MNTLHSFMYIIGIMFCTSAILKKMRGAWTAVFLAGVSLIMCGI